MIELRGIELGFGPKDIFRDLSVVIGARDRIGLVGSNGAGKSTFIKMLLGMVESDGGEIEAAHYVTLGYLPQDGVGVQGQPLFEEVEAALETVIQLREKIAEASERLDTLSVESADYAETLELIGGWEHELDALEGHKVKSRVERVLLGLGFVMSDMERPTHEFSGGWQMRIALAKLLLKQPSLLLLDEPTNHLDIESLQWLEQYLRVYEGAVLIVSHDRSFLDNLVTRTFHLSMGRLEDYAGNYSYYETESVKRRELLEKAYANQQRKIEHTEDFINRFRYKASKAKQVQSRIKALDKVDRIEIESTEKRIGFSFLPPPRSGQKVIELEGIKKSYGELNVLDGIDLTLERGDRVAIVGVNGAGKSTLVRIMAGQEPYQAGRCELGHNVSMSYFAQHQAEELDKESTALSIVEAASPAGEVGRARSLLGSFLFEGDDVFKHVKVLSGGERNRLALAKMLLQRCNFLILDEPTNHLDMQSKEVLKEAIRRYEGTLLVVSHDRHFLSGIVDKVVEVSKQSIRWYHGDLAYYLQKKEEEAVAASGQAVVAASNSGAGAMNSREKRQHNAKIREALRPLKKQLEQLEEDIGKLETAIADYEEQMKDPAFFQAGDDTAEKMREYETAKLNLDHTMEQWAEVQSEVEMREEDLVE